jgi:predicted NBD/HSP70 family sugar kinase
MKVLVIDVGGTHVKVFVSGEREPRKFESGPKLTARQMVAGVKKIVGDWKYDAVSIGFPGPVLRNRPMAEPVNLGRGWFGFNFKGAFGCPVKLVNDISSRLFVCDHSWPGATAQQVEQFTSSLRLISLNCRLVSVMPSSS